MSPLPQTKEPLSKSKGEIGVKSTKDKDEYIFSSEQDVDSFPFNMHEYEEGMSKRSVKGSLKMHAQFWYDIGAYRSVLDIIEHGYVIPFVKIPSPACFRNNSSATRHADFVTKAIQELLEDGRIIESKFVPSVVNPLSVSVNETGKKWLILDLRYINQFVKPQKFKLDDWRVMFQYVRKGNFMFKFDLKSGYHHIDISAEHQTFLGFAFEMEGCLKYFVFTVLPFGYCLGPILFTKVVRPLVKRWRSKGLQIAVYLDDGSATSQTFEKCENESFLVRNDLENSGFVVNAEKSIWGPTPCLEWVGFIWDCEKGVLKIPEKRILKVHRTIEEIFDRLFGVSARMLAKLTGLLISLTPSVGNISRLMTRSLYLAINQRSNWDKPINISLNVDILEELDFWQYHVRKLNGTRTFGSQIPIYQIRINSDASSFAAAAFIESEHELVTHRMFSEMEIRESSTYRELLAIENAIFSFLPKLENKNVLVCSDSMNAVTILEKGSSKVKLQAIAKKIFSICLKSNIHFQAQWIPRGENEVADYFSKLADPDDWGISDEFFHFLSKLGPMLTIDRFANAQNKKLPRFNSRYWNPECEAVDAFSQDWSREYNLVVPPVHLVTRCFHHWNYYKAKGVLVVPAWKSAVYWPVLFPLDSLLHKSLKKVHIIENYGNVFVPGSDKQSIFAKNLVREVLVVEFCGAL